jgi:hypothetical protein
MIIELDHSQGGRMGLEGLSSKTFRWVFYFLPALWIVLGPAALQANAQDAAASQESPEMTRPINIDFAGLGNFYYLTGSFNNSNTAGGSAELEGEALLKLDRDWGLDLVFPIAYLQEPIGQGPAALGPLGGGPRFIFARFRDEDGGAQGVFSVQAQAFGWATPDDRFDGDGSYSLTALGAVRIGRTYLQGNYGYNGAFDSNFTPSFFASNALGYALNGQWNVQVEADWTEDLLPDNGGTSSEWVLVPQIGFQTDGWLFEAGLGFTLDQAGTTTDFLIQKELF